MLNPSTADAIMDDPTIRRCIGYAEDWGYGRLVVGNLFALRSTDPRQLDDHSTPVGSDNDEHLLAICDEAEKIIVAWGTHGSLRDRDRKVAQLLNVDLYALDTTQDGHPAHPLYQPADIDSIHGPIDLLVEPPTALNRSIAIDEGTPFTFATFRKDISTNLGGRRVNSRILNGISFYIR